MKLNKKKIFIGTFAVSFFFAGYVVNAVANALVFLSLATAGTILATGAAGTYYAQNNELPFVTDAGNVMEKAWLTQQVVVRVAADLYADATPSLLAVPAALGANISDIVDYVIDYGDTAYQYWLDKINEFMAEESYDSVAIDNSGIITFNGTTYQLANFTYWTQVLEQYLPNGGYLPYDFIDNIGRRYTFSGLKLFQIGLADPSTNYCQIYKSDVTIVTDDSTVGTIPGALNIPGLLAGLDMTLAEPELQEILFNMPPAQLIESSTDIPGSVDSSPPPSLTNSEVENWLAQNSADIANAVSSEIQDLAAANPTDTALQVSALESIADAVDAETAAEEEKLDDFTATVPESPEWGEIDLSPLESVKGAFLTNAPFSWLADFGSVLDVINVPAVAPSFEIDLGFWQQNVSFDVMNPLASTFRIVTAFLL